MDQIEGDGVKAAGEYYPVVVIGGGQAGLSAGYHLAKRRIPFVILDAARRTGDSWRGRWDSLRLFTPAHLDGLDGMPFPAAKGTFPTKDQMANYLEEYARSFGLLVSHGASVKSLDYAGGRYHILTDCRAFEADHVVVAMSNYQKPFVPNFACDLAPGITQLHSANYRNPTQLREGAVLVVGAGNSGAEIALELAKVGKMVWLSGRDMGEVPFRIGSYWGRHVMSRLVLRFVFHYLLTTATPIGRRRRSSMNGRTPLIRTRSKELAIAGVERVPPVVGIEGGLPLLQNRRRLEPANVIWCTGFTSDFSWIRLPIFGTDGKPLHDRGIVTSQPGLYFLGLPFLFAMSSTMVHGVGRDARYVAKAVKVALFREKSMRTRRASRHSVLAQSQKASTANVKMNHF